MGLDTNDTDFMNAISLDADLLCFAPCPVLLYSLSPTFTCGTLIYFFFDRGPYLIIYKSGYQNFRLKVGMQEAYSM